MSVIMDQFSAIILSWIMQSGNHGSRWVSGAESRHSRKYFPSVNKIIIYYDAEHGWRPVMMPKICYNKNVISLHTAEHENCCVSDPVLSRLSTECRGWERGNIVNRSPADYQVCFPIIHCHSGVPWGTHCSHVTRALLSAVFNLNIWG